MLEAMISGALTGAVRGIILIVFFMIIGWIGRKIIRMLRRK